MIKIPTHFLKFTSSICVYIVMLKVIYHIKTLKVNNDKMKSILYWVLHLY